MYPFDLRVAMSVESCDGLSYLIYHISTPAQKKEIV